jgi:alkylation response protein AidB-like acyl-CoA dehydrogenase
MSEPSTAGDTMTHAVGTAIESIPGGVESVLTDDMLERFRERAPVYDREIRFFHEDFEELRHSGYLKIAIPLEFGGLGLRLDDIARLQRKLARYAPATAIATNMHLYWTSFVADMCRMGDESLTWVLQEAADGEIFAAGHGETGVDLAGYFSTTRAERVDGGYRFYGHKMFGSLSPVWTRLGLWAMDSSNPEQPMMVHGTLTRESQGYQIKETWDTMAMRATASHDTIVDGAFCPDHYIMRVLPAGVDDLYMLCMFATVEATFGAIYLGIADRALELAVESARKRTSITLTRSMAYHPEIQHLVADAGIALEGATAHIERIADDWVNGVDHGLNWGMKLVAAKHHAVTAAQHVVDTAMTISGGGGMFKRNELERLYRDVRAGGFHPANAITTYEVVGKTLLGIDPTEQPRWG